MSSIAAVPARRLIEPDYWTCPHGKRVRPAKMNTFGPEVADLCATAGFAPDPQQELGLDLIFAIDEAGRPATFEFCVICARQNLKTGLFIQTVIGWLFVLDVPEVVWSAHEMSTTRQAQRDLERILLGVPVLRKRMRPQRNNGVYDANGEERIELATDQTIWFKARTRDGGRGLAKPKLILDEAFALKAAMMGALIPIMLAQVDPQVIMGSSPGKADSEVLFEVRERGRKHLSPRMTYLEWSNGERPPCQDEDCKHPKTGLRYGDPCVANRLELIEHANPTLSTGRITIQTLEDVRQTIPTAEEWLRECAGYWEEPIVSRPGVMPNWVNLGTAEEPPPVTAIGVAIDVDRVWCSIGAATVSADRAVPYVGPVFMREAERARVALSETVELRVDDEARKVPLVVAEAARIQRETGCVVCADKKGPAGSLEDDFTFAGVDVLWLGLDEVVQACSDLHDAVQAGLLEHNNDLDLNGAVEAAGWRKVGDRQVWARRGGNIVELEAVTLALWGAKQPEVQPWAEYD